MAGRGGMVGLSLVTLLILAAIFAPLLAPHPSDVQIRDAILLGGAVFADRNVEGRTKAALAGYGSSNTPGFSIPCGSSARFAAFSAAANRSGR